MQKSPIKRDQYDYLVKVLVLGDSSVGKTNILTRYTENKFQATHMPTIGIDFKIKTIQIDDKLIKMQIWDTAGQDRFKTIISTYYHGAAGIVLVYAVNERTSFNNLQNWIKQISENTEQNIAKVLVGNKSDIVENRAVDRSEGERLASQYSMPFLEASAKDNINIDQIFQLLGKQIKEQVIPKMNDNVVLDQKDDFSKMPEQSRCKC